MKLFDEYADLILRDVPLARETPVCVELSHVAQYLYRNNPKEHWDWADFPDLTPPWHCAWYEWEAPAETNFNGTRIVDDLPTSYNGVLALSTPGNPDGWTSILFLWVYGPTIRREPVLGAQVFMPVSPEGKIRWQNMTMAAVGGRESIWSLLFPYCLGVSFANCPNTQLEGTTIPLPPCTKQDEYTWLWSTKAGK